MGKGLAGLGMIVLAVAVSACSAPRFTYISNTSANTYFKVPSAWHKLDDTVLATIMHGGTSSAQPAGVWSIAYDASAPPSGSHVFGGQTPAPFTFAFVEKLTSAQSRVISDNALRDMYLPVTAVTRQSAALSGFRLTHFHLLRDTTLSPGQGVHGVRVVYDYTFPSGSTDTFDQIALTNAHDTEVYLLVTHCVFTCYQQHHSEIETVMTSFTVRSQ